MRRGRPGQARFPQKTTPPRFALHLQLGQAYNHHLNSSPTPKCYTYSGYRSTIPTKRGRELLRRSREARTDISAARLSSNAIASPSRLRGSVLVGRFRHVYRWPGNSNNAILVYQMVNVPEIMVWGQFRPPDRSAHGTEKDSPDQGRGAHG